MKYRNINIMTILTCDEINQYRYYYYTYTRWNMPESLWLGLLCLMIDANINITILYSSGNMAINLSVIDGVCVWVCVCVFSHRGLDFWVDSDQIWLWAQSGWGQNNMEGPSYRYHDVSMTSRRVFSLLH